MIFGLFGFLWIARRGWISGYASCELAASTGIITTLVWFAFCFTGRAAHRQYGARRRPRYWRGVGRRYRRSRPRADRLPPCRRRRHRSRLNRSRRHSSCYEACSAFLLKRHSRTVLTTNVTSASNASSEATANAAGTSSS